MRQTNSKHTTRDDNFHCRRAQLIQIVKLKDLNNQKKNGPDDHPTNTKFISTIQLLKANNFATNAVWLAALSHSVFSLPAVKPKFLFPLKTIYKLLPPVCFNKLSICTIQQRGGKKKFKSTAGKRIVLLRREKTGLA